MTFYIFSFLVYIFFLLFYYRKKTSVIKLDSQERYRGILYQSFIDIFKSYKNDIFYILGFSVFLPGIIYFLNKNISLLILSGEILFLFFVLMVLLLKFIITNFAYPVFKAGDKDEEFLFILSEFLCYFILNIFAYYISVNLIASDFVYIYIGGFYVFFVLNFVKNSYFKFVEDTLFSVLFYFSLFLLLNSSGIKGYIFYLSVFVVFIFSYILNYFFNDRLRKLPLGIFDKYKVFYILFLIALLVYSWYFYSNLFLFTVVLVIYFFLIILFDFEINNRFYFNIFILFLVLIFKILIEMVNFYSIYVSPFNLLSLFLLSVMPVFIFYLSRRKFVFFKEYIKAEFREGSLFSGDFKNFIILFFFIFFSLYITLADYILRHSFEINFYYIYPIFYSFLGVALYYAFEYLIQGELLFAENKILNFAYILVFISAFAGFILFLSYYILKTDIYGVFSIFALFSVLTLFISKRYIIFVLALTFLSVTNFFFYVLH